MFIFQEQRLFMLKSKQRAYLRGYANKESVNDYVLGKDNIKDTILEMLDKSLEANEIIKISLLKSFSNEICSSANAIAEKLNAEVVQIIGRTAIIFRQNPKYKVEGKSILWK